MRRFYPVFIEFYIDLADTFNVSTNFDLLPFRGIKMWVEEIRHSLNYFKESNFWNRIQIVIGCKFFISLFIALIVVFQKRKFDFCFGLREEGS